MKFNYQARNKTGEVQMGTVEAASREGALVLLQRHGLYVTSLEGSEGAPIYSRKIDIAIVSKKDLVIFSRQLAIMFRSKVPLVESLRTLSEQSTKGNLKEKILKISERIEGGTSFSQALALYPKLFDPFYINMVKSGEASGKLSEALDYLADHLEREYNFRSKIRGAMMYPIIILAMMIGIMFLMSFYVLPQLTGMLQDTDQELPMITKMIIAGTDFVRGGGGLAFIIIFIGLAIFLYKFSKTKGGKGKMDRILLKIPMLGSLLRMMYVTRFAENLSTLISGGLPIARALEISGKVVGNTIFEKAILQTSEDVKKGEKISNGFKRHPKLFPPMFTTMVLVGEKTGTLDTTLINVVNFYQTEVNRNLDSFLRILEPLLIMFLGGGVGILIAAILMPLYQAMTSI
jgi:type IV pilus assembly protein PilC